jgi:hypothetical protein
MNIVLYIILKLLSRPVVCANFQGLDANTFPKLAESIKATVLVNTAFFHMDARTLVHEKPCIGGAMSGMFRATGLLRQGLRAPAAAPIRRFGAGGGHGHADAPWGGLHVRRPRHARARARPRAGNLRLLTRRRAFCSFLLTAGVVLRAVAPAGGAEPLRGQGGLDHHVPLDDVPRVPRWRAHAGAPPLPPMPPRWTVCPARSACPDCSTYSALLLRFAAFLPAPMRLLPRAGDGGGGAMTTEMHHQSKFKTVWIATQP